jgi:predicted ABC-type transport system involved in lysophospholipase L1 biosynthesis ATPase subunit
MTLLALTDVCKSYRDGMRTRLVLDHVSLDIDAGETIGVLASRRAGKTTLLKVAAGLEQADSGSVRWEGEDLAAMNADRRARYRRRRGIALASCDWRPGTSEPVVTHVATPLYSDTLKMGQAERCAHRALERVGASNLGHHMTDRLGVSERVRVELARALVGEPRVLLVDEPAILPRPSEARELFALLHELPTQLGVALVIASEEVTAVRGSHRVMNLDGQLHSTEPRRRVVELRPGRGTRSAAS